MLQTYRDHTAERALDGIPPEPLNAQQTADLVALFKAPAAGEENYMLELLTQHVPAGVDEAA
jgi:aconitate hydratase 2/2-methylisocitrate dehydratase